MGVAVRQGFENVSADSGAGTPILAFENRRYRHPLDALGHLNREITVPYIAVERRLLWALALATPMGFLAIEAGWVVTEVGRQPWLVTGVLRTAQAVTPMPGLGYTLAGFTALYLLLALVVSRLLYGLIVQTPSDTEWHRQYIPPILADA